jgi:hypothetical protein
MQPGRGKWARVIIDIFVFEALVTGAFNCTIRQAITLGKVPSAAGWMTILDGGRGPSLCYSR